MRQAQEIQDRVIDAQKACQCLGGEELFLKTAEWFLDELDHMTLTLEEAVVSGIPEEIRDKAHWVKGGLAYLHATASAQAAKNLEEAAHSGPKAVKLAHRGLVVEIEKLSVRLMSLTERAQSRSL